MSSPSVVLVGFDQSLLERLLRNLEGLAQVLVSRSRTETLDILATHDVAVLCVGPGISGHTASDLVRDGLTPDRITGRPVERRNVVLVGGSDPEIRQSLVDHANVFYVSRQPPAPEAIARILRSALEHPQRSAQAGFSARRLREIDELARSIVVETDPRRFGLGVARRAEELVRADRARCLYYDLPSDSFAAWAPKGSTPWVGKATSGVAGFVARTGLAVRTERAGDDPRYEPDLDGPGGDRAERLLAVPVNLPPFGDEGAPKGSSTIPAALAVLVVTRGTEAAPFTDLDVRLLELLADRLAPAFARLAASGDDRDSDDAERESGRETSLFTAEALNDYHGHSDEMGHPIEVAPRWTKSVYALLVIVLVLGLLYFSIGTIDEYARGIAVIRLDEAAAVDVAARGPVAPAQVASEDHTVEASSIIAVFPARFRPQLEPGMVLHFEIDGLDVEPQRLPIGSVGEVVAPSGVRRILGASVPDVTSLGGPVVVVHCPLISGHLTSEYYDGVQGAAEVKVGSERLLFSLLPALRSFGEARR